MTLLVFAIAAILSYLVGSIPTGYLMAKAKGVDIRTVGSGNMGATNVFRVLGKGPAIVTLVIDCAKGAAAVLLVPRIVGPLFGILSLSALPIVCALFVILGHNYTCWLKFKGGKGIATSAGALLALSPWAILVCLAVWLIVFGLGRYVSLASIVAALALPVAVYFTEHIGERDESHGERYVLFYLSIVLCLLAIWKHRPNINRLLNGTENRFTRKPKPETPTS